MTNDIASLMEQKIDYNALLLQVMAHDLLAPLTAVKWQLELLNRDNIDTAKRNEYLQHLGESTELGISLTKHAHVAGRVLVGAYQSDNAMYSLPTILEGAAKALQSQYERHGVTLELSFDAESQNRQFDKELAGLFIWALAKYFLSCVPAQTAVSMRGMEASSDREGVYVIICSASNVPEVDACVSVFNSQEARGAYDEAFVFARLVHDVAQLLGITVSANRQGNGLLVEATCGSVAVAQ